MTFFIYFKVEMEVVEQTNSCVESPNIASLHGGYVI